MTYNKIVKAAAVKLRPEEILEKLKQLNAAISTATSTEGNQAETKEEPSNGWHLLKFQGQECIQKSFTLRNFENTSSFINQVNMRAHLLGHHPTVQYTYNKVDIILQTHDAKGLTDVDFVLAKKLTNYAKKYK